jgi:hypothetical protein|tara:strand:- start:695 stop:1315 length:621 start_codon:yes stop_codon:yes gene_type:complete
MPPIKLEITPLFNNQTITEKTWYVSSQKDSIQFTKLKFYLTDFQLKSKEGIIKSIENSNYLIDVFNPSSLDILLNTTSFSLGDELSFNLGVSSAMNTSGAHSGALDPSNGMFWSWQSGYINFKIEGLSPSCVTRKNKFQFHIGGYQAPHNTLRRLSFILNKQTTQLNLNLEGFFEGTKLAVDNQVMVPGEKANELATVFFNTLTIN